MIVEYHRPETVEEALQLLNRQQPETLPLAGGSVINQPSTRKIAVVDLQALGLNDLREQRKFPPFGSDSNTAGHTGAVQFCRGHKHTIITPAVHRA